MSDRKKPQQPRNVDKLGKWIAQSREHLWRSYPLAFPVQLEMKDVPVLGRPVGVRQPRSSSGFRGHGLVLPPLHIRPKPVLHPAPSFPRGNWLFRERLPV